MARKLKGRQLTGKGLKGALQKHQIIENDKAKHSKTLVTEQQRQKDKAASMKSGGKQKKSSKNQNVQKKAFIPFEPKDTVLLVGEGDFTFARSLITQSYIEPENLIATSFDSHQELIDKYPDVQAVLDELKDYGVTVLHEIDCTKLPASLNLTKKQRTPLFRPAKRLNYIMFNFPHTGRGMKDMDRNVRDHQKLVLSYFENCKELFKIVNADMVPSSKQDFSGYDSLANNENSKQKIILSLFEGEPYISWGVKALARNVGYRVERSGAMDWTAFEGYHHKRTNGIRDTTKPAAERDARIYVFDKSLSKEEYEKLATKKKAKADDSDSE
ncbi:hypothetical protein PUMCH_000689 [Australozyma saopauloensis]|uniref:25S rRNA (uridine-N(3))-methyltransferase BMT5-like domain-containing protein n=1 Tax=Australozyma saopauloensis TaxID=291208 RepID=A0AAX4H4T5_9ASCO|nr:hypothetical protein PUMCH_000689 [[Candida] saopauloensis]